jgi:CelD/BcsL family acetyltransferase involved in cellulose biosynthesis
MIEIICDPGELHSLEHVWNELADGTKNPLLRYEWFAACAEAFCQPGQLWVAVSRSKNGINSIAPLILKRHNGITSYELLGASKLYEPSGCICKDETSVEELIRDIISSGRPAYLGRLDPESPEVSLLREINRKSSFILLRDSTGSPYLPITASWYEFEATMSSRHRYDLRRSRKRAEELGNVKYEIVSPGPDALNQYLAEFVRVEAAGWKGRNRTALQLDGSLKRFFYLYSSSACHLGTLRLCFLRINDMAVAALLAVQCYNRFWVLKIGYDEAFSRCSPGILLMHETIHYAYNNGLEAYEFLGSEAPWIRMWTDQNHPYVTARIYPYSTRGQVSLGMDIVSFAFRKASKIVKRKVG